MANYFTKAQKLKALCKRAAELGLTFKRQRCYVNNQAAYFVEDRTTGKSLSRNLTIDSAWDQHEASDFLAWIAETK